MNRIQGPNVAGLFYPDDPETLLCDLSGYLAGAKIADLPVPKAIIAPHAGYMYSGPVAASAYAQILAGSNTIRRVVLLAPSHRVRFSGIALSSASHFTTPLGDIPVDQEAVEQISRLNGVTVLDAAFAQEHALEVQLPFLQTTLQEFTLVPMVVGTAAPFEIKAILDELWGGEETLIVVSSDLSHYENYDSARKHDRRTSEQIEALGQNLGYDDACGRNPVLGLLAAAREHGLQVATLDLRNSGDTAGSRDRVVGYGAYAFY